MKKISQNRQTNWTKKLSRYTPVLAVVVVFGGLGTALLLTSHAATPVANIESESGTVSAKAGNVADASASGGQEVKFGVTGGTASCKVSTPNVADGPDPWGGCFPGPLSTGVPAGTTLTAYTGPCDITTANTVIDSKTVNCGLGIHAANVMIKNSKVNGGVWLDTDIAGSTSWSFTLQDSEVDVGVQQLASVLAGNMTVIRSNIHGGETGIQCEEKSVLCNVSDSYMHGQQLPVNANWHLGGMLSDGGGPITLTHNFFICDQQATYGTDGGCTGDLNFIPNFATTHDVTVQNNLLGSNINASYCTYGGEKPSSPYPHANHVVYKNNIFQRGTNGKCAAYGPVTDFEFTGTGNVWTNNKYDDGTAIVCTVADECL